MCPSIPYFRLQVQLQMSMPSCCNRMRLTLNAYVCSCSTPVRHFPVCQFPVRHFPVLQIPVLQIQLFALMTNSPYSAPRILHVNMPLT